MRKIQWVPVLMVAAAIGFGGCGSDSDDTPPEPAVAPTPPPPAAPIYTASNGVVWRWSDGDWVARVTIDIQNPTAAPLVVARAGILAAGMRPWAASSTFPETANIAPGQRVTGDVAWYSSRTGAMPAAATISFGTWTTTAALQRVSLPPPAGTAVPGPAVGTVTLSASGPATTWRHTDQDHIVRLGVSLTNGTNLPVEIPARYFAATVGTMTGSRWSVQTTIADPLVLQPGQSTTGFLSWYFDDAAPVPTSLNVRLGAPQEPLATFTAAVTPGQAPN